MQYLVVLKWARFRNRLRQRYYARRGKTLNPETVLNETGTADMVVEKIHHRSNKVVPQQPSPRTVVKGLLICFLLKL